MGGVVLKLFNINWPVRFRNPIFWAQLVLAFFLPVLAYAGIEFKDVNSWPVLFSIIWLAFQNPYVLALIIMSLWHAVNDPTTAGLGDSAQALTYTAPVKKIDTKTK